MEVVEAEVVADKRKDPLFYLMIAVLALGGVSFVGCLGCVVLFAPDASEIEAFDQAKFDREFAEAQNEAIDAGKLTPDPDEPTLTAKTFRQCELGMSFDQVVAIIGQPDSLSSENEIGGVHTALYTWKGGFLEGANLMFQDGKLIQKSQFGL